MYFTARHKKVKNFRSKLSKKSTGIIFTFANKTWVSPHEDFFPVFTPKSQDHKHAKNKGNSS